MNHKPKINTTRAKASILPPSDTRPVSTVITVTRVVSSSHVGPVPAITEEQKAAAIAAAAAFRAMQEKKAIRKQINNG